MAGFSVDEIKLAMETLKVDNIKQVDTRVFPNSAGIVPPGALEAKLKDLQPSNSDIVHWIDFIKEHEEPGGFNFEALRIALDNPEPKYKDLPAPLCPKAAVPDGTAQNIAILDVPGRQHVYTIINWYTFPQRTARAIARSAAHGQCKMMDFGAQSGKLNAIHFHYLFEKMGGWQARSRSLSVKTKDKGDKDSNHKNFMLTLTDEEVDDGLAYMMKAPDEPVKQLIWVTKALKNETPLKGWPQGYVEKALAKYAQEGAFAKKQYQFALTLKDIREWYLTEIITKYWGQIKSKALIMLGEAGRGKTPIAQIIAKAVAEYWYEVHGEQLPPPCYRITTDIDFLRGATGVKTCVDIADDADSNTIPIRKLKSLTDVSIEETLSRERWTAVKWVQACA